MSRSSELVEPQEGVLGTSSFQEVAQKHRWQPGPAAGIWSWDGGRLMWTCGWHLELGWGQAHVAGPLTRGTCLSLQVRCQNWAELKDTQLRLRNCLICGKPLLTWGQRWAEAEETYKWGRHSSGLSLRPWQQSFPRDEHLCLSASVSCARP